jgi:hypothetical protein
VFDLDQTAVFYDDNHRVWLRRRLREGVFKPAVFCLHNPSTAGKIKNDPTATRGVNFAVAWDCSDLIFVNAATRIATKANEIPIDAELNCPWSDWALQRGAELAMDNGGYLVAAWGAPKGRAAVMRKMAARYEEIRALGLPFSALRVTDSGYPEHPLYLPSTLLPEPFPWPSRSRYVAPEETVHRDHD